MFVLSSATEVVKVAPFQNSMNFRTRTPQSDPFNCWRRCGWTCTKLETSASIWILYACSALWSAINNRRVAALMLLPRLRGNDESISTLPVAKLTTCTCQWLFSQTGMNIMSHELRSWPNVSGSRYRAHLSRMTYVVALDLRLLRTTCSRVRWINTNINIYSSITSVASSPAVEVEATDGTCMWGVLCGCSCAVNFYDQNIWNSE